MADLLLDTNVFSYNYKGDTRAALYTRHLTGNRLHLAFATVAELYRWAVWHGWGHKRVSNLTSVLAAYGIIYCDDDTVWRWAEVMSLRGHSMNHGDAWIAATALRHALPLVTHNRKHFEHVPGLTVISEA